MTEEHSSFEAQKIESRLYHAKKKTHKKTKKQNAKAFFLFCLFLITAPHRAVVPVFVMLLYLLIGVIVVSLHDELTRSVVKRGKT